MENVTLTTFQISRKEPNKAGVLQTVWKRITNCYTSKTDEEIYEQLNGWDQNFILDNVVRLTEIANTSFFPSGTKQFPLTVLFYTVMNMPQTDVFYLKSDAEIHEIIEARKFQSYYVTMAIHCEKYNIDALNSITRYKDTN